MKYGASLYIARAKMRNVDLEMGFRLLEEQ